MNMLSFKKENIKYLAAGAWLLFLIVFWNTTIKLISDFYGMSTSNGLPAIIGIIAFTLFVIPFIFPLVILPLYSTVFKAFLHNPSANLIAESTCSSFKNGLIRGLTWLLLLLLVGSMISYFGSESLKNWLPDFTPMFEHDITQYLPSVKESGLVYSIVTVLPKAFAIALPELFLILANFISELPLLAAIVLFASICQQFWQKRKTIQSI